MTKKTAYKSYAEKLKDPRWQKKRLEILQRDEWTCQRCGDKEETLHVHHKFYVKGCEPWDLDNFAYLTLCESCHETVTMEDDFVAKIFGVMGKVRRANVIAFMSGLMEGTEAPPPPDYTSPFEPTLKMGRLLAGQIEEAAASFPGFKPKSGL